jgi:hypothetical protein
MAPAVSLPITQEAIEAELAHYLAGRPLSESCFFNPQSVGGGDAARGYCRILVPFGTT